MPTHGVDRSNSGPWGLVEACSTQGEGRETGEKKICWEAWKLWYNDCVRNLKVTTMTLKFIIDGTFPLEADVTVLKQPGEYTEVTLLPGKSADRLIDDLTCGADVDVIMGGVRVSPWVWDDEDGVLRLFLP